MTKAAFKPIKEGGRSMKRKPEEQLSEALKDPANPDLAVNAPDVAWLKEDGGIDMQLAQDTVNQILDKQFKEATTGVWVNGLRIPKLKTVEMDRHGRVEIDGVSRHLPLPAYTEEERKVRELSLYCILNQGKKHYYLLDDNSSVHLTIGTGDINLIQDFDDPEPVMLLVNSRSKDDSVVGNSTLFNVGSDNCVFNQSMVYWNEHAPSVWEKHDTSGIELSLVKLKKMQVVNTRLPSGNYSNGTIKNCRFVSTLPAIIVSWSNLFNTVIDANDMVIDRATLSDVDIRCEGLLDIRNTDLRSVRRIRTGGSVFIPNKFSVLEVETLVNPLVIIREDQDTFVVAGQWRENIPTRFGINATREELVELLKELWRFHLEVGGGDVLLYVAESIVSRLRVIRLLDDTAKVTELVSTTRSYPGYVSFHKY